jgi:hypothetical protein
VVAPTRRPKGELRKQRLAAAEAAGDEVATRRVARGRARKECDCIRCARLLRMEAIPHCDARRVHVPSLVEASHDSREPIMCLSEDSRRTREFLLLLQAEYPLGDHPAGVPHRRLLEVMRPQHDQLLKRIEALLASQPAAGKLNLLALGEYKRLLAEIEDLVKKRLSNLAGAEGMRIAEGYVPSVTEVKAVREKLLACGKTYVEQKVSKLRREYRNSKCTVCPKESVPQRVFYIMLPQDDVEWSDLRIRMRGFLDSFHRSSWRFPIGMHEQGIGDAVYCLRTMIGTGIYPGGKEKIPAYSEIRNPAILYHEDRITEVSDWISKAWEVYYVVRSASLWRSLPEWVKPIAPLAVSWFNDTRNFILDEVNAMQLADQPLPRITGANLFPAEWNVPATHVSPAKIDLDVLGKQYVRLMSFAVEHRSDDPFPEFRPAQAPNPRGGGPMPRRLSPKAPQRSRSRETVKQRPSGRSLKRRKA